MKVPLSKLNCLNHNLNCVSLYLNLCISYGPLTQFISSDEEIGIYFPWRQPAQCLLLISATLSSFVTKR
jgi:hypothetical protein